MELAGLGQGKKELCKKTNSACNQTEMSQGPSAHSGAATERDSRNQLRQTSLCGPGGN